ncbi:MAG TPA: c-type cytochrome [Gammaproteobacteria bacterium]|nr:c-type cytochrome [Gammaproteobacteria bacterium]
MTYTKPFSLYLASLMLILGLMAVVTAPVRAADEAAVNTTGNAEAALHVLAYLSVDYPATVREGKIINAAEYAEQQEFATRLVALMEALPPGPQNARFQQQARQLLGLINARAEGDKIKAISSTLSNDLIVTFRVATAPRRLPDIQSAAVIFQAQCSGCHGAEGYGDGPDAVGLDPAPANFHDRERQDQLSLYGLYNTITQGVEGTAMRGFVGELDNEQRWALAFYVGRMAFPPEMVQQGEQRWSEKPLVDLSGLQTLTALSMADARARWGEDGPPVMAYLRNHPELLLPKASANLTLARQRLDDSLKAYTAGDRERAQSAAVAAYLEGFEPLENGLRTRDPQLVGKIELAMASYRQALRKGAGVETVRTRQQEILGLLDEAESRLQDERLSSDAAFFSALIILLREGLEAILILAAVGAVLIKAGRRDALRYLHAGWISALLLGGVTWVLANFVIGISGAGREITEGVTALLASAVLLYVGFWLHGKTQGQRWQQFVKQRIQTALHGGALWVLALVSFLAVYREVFETVLFYQALWLQSTEEAGSALLGGIATAAGVLVLLAWIILRSSLRLPLKLFFNVNATIMLVLAVAFAGHGVNSLQEAGYLPVDPVNFIHVALLGIYPNLETLLTQGVLLLIIGAIIWFEHRRQPPARA